MFRWSAFSWALNCVLLILCVALYFRRVHRPPSINASSWLQRPAAEVFSELPSPPGSTVFLGDSITAQGPWGELFHALLNRGVHGDTIAGVLARLDEVLDRRPRQLVLMIGINDLQAGRSPEQIADGVEKLLQLTRRRSPQTSVIVSSTLPVRDDGTRLTGLPEAILELNRLLAQECAAHEATFVDLQAAFSDERGQLASELTYDGLHLTPRGYLLWAKHLEPHLDLSPR